MLHTLLTRAAEDDWKYYGYNPSFTMPIVCAALFGATFIGHVILMFKYKSFKLMWPFTLGCVGEVVGYAMRRLSAAHPTGRQLGLKYYIGQELCILLSPALFAATIYMTYGRLITYVGPKYSIIRPSRVTAFFVFFDIASFAIQGAGGSLYSSDNTSIYPTAKGILLAGFIVQIVSLGFFAIQAAVYQTRVKRSGEPEGKWSLCLYTLYIGSIFILIRGIFRTIEFGSGGNNTGYLLEHEAFYYGLETLPIFLCAVLFLVSYPARYVPKDRTLRLHPEDYPSEEGFDEKTSNGSGKAGRKWWGGKKAEY